MSSRAAALALGAALAAAGCGVKGPPRPAGAPDRPAPKDTTQAAPPAAPTTPATEAAR